MSEDDTRRVARPPQPPGDLRASVEPAAPRPSASSPRSEDTAILAGAAERFSRGLASRVIFAVAIVILAIALYFIFG